MAPDQRKRDADHPHLLANFHCVGAVAAAPGIADNFKFEI
jgi:hypothetical protein